MKKLLLSTALLALSCVSLAEPSFRAPNLGALTLGEDLCYDAIVYVDDREDTAKNLRAETQLAAALKGLGLRAAEFDDADTCDRVLKFIFQADNDGPPMLFHAALQVDSYVAFDSRRAVNIATVWQRNNWGGYRSEVAAATISEEMTKTLTNLLQIFKDDFRSLPAAGQRT